MDQVAADAQGSPDSASGPQQEPQSQPGLWAWIRQRINLALYRPEPAAGVVSSELRGREGVYYVLRTHDASSYLKLTVEDYYVWTQMDGQRTVKDLVVAYFMRFGTFAFDRVGQLVRELRRGGFLVDRPLEVMTRLQAELKERELAGKGERLTAAFIHHEILIPGVDSFLDRLYRYTSWLFAWPVQILLLLSILAGLVVFAATLSEGQVPLLTAGGSYLLGLVVLLLINVGIIVIHELAHGLTTKHFGREVRRGGFLIYYGYPAFFVDTMDMWLAGRGQRIAVSWAGMHSGLVIGGLCALLTRALPASALAPYLFKTAFVAYAGVFFNLNPLLELDGYFILIDLLDIPMLRERSFRFVRTQLWGELRDAWRKWRQGAPDWRAGFTREERLLALFGLLAALYTLYSLWVAVYFWQTRIVIGVRDLWNRPGWLGKLFLVAVLIAIVIPVGAALFAQLVAWGWRGIRWLERRGFFDRDRNVNLLLLALLLLLTLGPVLIDDPWWSRYLAFAPLLLLTLAALAFVHTALRYQGADFQRVFWALTVVVGVLWVAALLRALAHLRGVSDATANDTFIVLIHSLERLAALPLALAGFLGLTGVDLRRGPPWERAAMAALIFAAGLIALPVARWTADAPLGKALLSVSAPYLTLVYLVTVLPTLTAFAHSRFFTPWITLTMAAILTGVVGFLRAVPDPPAPDSDLDRWLALVMAGLWALGAALYDLATQRVRFERREWTSVQVVSDEERLRFAFARFFAGLFDAFQDAFGAWRAQALDDELDVLAVAADWDIEIDGGRVVDELDLDSMTLGDQADRYRELLARTVDMIDDWAGRPFVRRAAQAAYDSLPWPEREVLGRYVLSGTDWGAAIAAQYATIWGVRRRLVRALPLFYHCDERALDLITAALKDQRVEAGTILARQRAPVDRFILLQSGEVELWRRDETTGISQMAGELRRGSSLGEMAFFRTGQYQATYRASAPSEILVLDRTACNRLVRAGVAVASRVGASLELMRLLSGMPLFSHLSPQQLSVLANKMRRQTILGGQVVAHSGEERHSVFIVVDGAVEALNKDAQGKDVVAHIHTSGEHFGEYALFADTPYQFTYRSRDRTTLLTLDEAVFDELVAQSERMAGYVAQIGSGRLLTAQHRGA